MSTLGPGVYSTIIRGYQNRISNIPAVSTDDVKYYKEVVLDRRYRCLADFRFTAVLDQAFYESTRLIPLGYAFTGTHISGHLDSDINRLPPNVDYTQSMLVLDVDSRIIKALWIEPLTGFGTFILAEKPAHTWLADKDKEAFLHLCFQMLLDLAPEDAVRHVTDPVLSSNDKTRNLLKAILFKGEPLPYIKEPYASQTKEA